MQLAGNRMLASAIAMAAACGNSDSGGWPTEYPVDKSALVSTGSSQFFPLRPGHRVALAKGTQKLVVTVLNETRTVDGVETRVVEERETDGERLKEISRNYFAMDPTTRNVYYFGEEVDEYEDGKVTGHEGSWLSGVNGARFGLAMPGTPALGARFSQELAPGVAMDRVEVIAVKEQFTSQDVARYQECIRTQETTPLEPKVREYKIYCPGIGLVKDGDLKLSEVTIP